MAPRLQAVRRRHSHCVAWPATHPAPLPAQIYNTRRASFSRGQLLAGLQTGRFPTEPVCAPYAPYGAAPYGTAGSSDDCYVSDASEDAVEDAVEDQMYGEAPPRREPVVDGFTDADLMYVTSSLYGESAGYGYSGYPPASFECSRFQLTNYGHLKIDYSCSWRSLDHYIAHS